MITRNGVDVAIEVTDMTVTYGGNRVLDRLSIRVPAGGVYGLLGRNGTGKTTVVHHLLGHERPRSGRVAVLGLDSTRDRQKLMTKVAFVPESSLAPPDATADQLLALGDRLYETWDHAGAAARLARFGVPQNVRFGGLSKGQQKQVELAFALAQRPDVLILDDPSLGLDSVAKRVLYEELLEHLADQGVTVFLTSHDLEALERLVDTVAILDHGKLIVEESLDGLKQGFRRIRFAAGDDESVPAEAAVVSRRLGPWGAEVVVAVDDAREVLARAAETGTATVESMSLEHIFEALVGPDSVGGPA